LVFLHILGLFRAAPCGPIPFFELSTDIACGTYRYGLTALIFVAYFSLLSFRLSTRWSIIARRTGLAVSVVLLGFLGYGLFLAIYPPTSIWHPLSPEHSPNKRAFAAIAYDTKRQRAVLFGGVSRWNGNDTVYDSSTWEWDGQDWHEMKPAVSPPGRFLHAMVYDEKNDVTILYGGKNQNGAMADLWAWDGTNWKQLCPVCNPAGRYLHEMFYDPQKEQVFLYGGYNEDKAYGEAWSWNGTDWGYFQFSTSAPGLLNSPLVYDQAHQRAIAYIKDADWGGTWFWEGDAWKRLVLPVQPASRSEAVMVYDPNQDKTIFFGGETFGTWYKDTWVFNGDTWTELKPLLVPSHRTATVAFYDPVRQSMILYGGENAGIIFGDTWELVLPGGNQ